MTRPLFFMNPVRAGMVAAPEQWSWSSYRAMLGLTPTPGWLALDGLLSQFGSERAEVRRRYRTFVLEGVGQDIWQRLRQQIYLGDEAFVKRMQAKAEVEGDTLSVPQAQRRPPPAPLSEIAARPGGRNAAIVALWRLTWPAPTVIGRSPSILAFTWQPSGGSSEARCNNARTDTPDPKLTPAPLAEIGQELHAKTYRPLLVKRCWIEKPGKPEKRPLGIPGVPGTRCLYGDGH